MMTVTLGVNTAPPRRASTILMIASSAWAKVTRSMGNRPSRMRRSSGIVVITPPNA
jgi:hypothetical protein